MTESETMTSREDEIRERAERATKGPWRAHDTWIDYGGYTATILSGKGSDIELRAWLPTFSNQPGLRTRNVVSDAEFMAHAREDIPWLLAELVKVRAELAQVRQHSQSGPV